MAKNGSMKRSLRNFVPLALVELLLFQSIALSAGTGPGSTFNQEWQGLKDHLAQQPNLPLSGKGERFRRYLLPLKDRLERILPVQREALAAPEAQTGRLSPWLVENLENSVLLTEIDQELSGHPKKNEITQAVKQAAAAQKKGREAFLAGQKEASARLVAQAAEATQTALDLWANREAPPKEGEAKSSDQSGEQKPSPNQSQKDQGKSESPANKPGESQASSGSLSSKPGQEPAGEGKDPKSVPLSSKEALRSLLKLQAQAQEQKRVRQEKLGAFRSGPEPVEKDW